PPPHVPTRRSSDLIGWRGIWSAHARCLPSGLSPSVPDFHRFNRPMDSAGSRTVTAGSDFHRPRSTRNDTCLTRLALYLCRVRTHSRCDTRHGLSVLSGAFSTGVGNCANPLLRNIRGATHVAQKATPA